MKKMFTLLSAGVLFAASAATLSTTSGTTFADLTAGDAFSASEAAAEGGKYYWYSADAQSGTNIALAANYNGACGRPNQFANDSTLIALAVDADAPLYRAAEGSDSAFSSPSFTQVDLGEGGLYIDAVVRFEMCRDGADIADDTGKLAVWLNSETNLVITAGKTENNEFTTNNYVVATLGGVAATFSPDAWYRLTIKAITADSKIGFNVYVDGKLAADGDGVTAFPSLVPAATQLSALLFQGVGSVDDISFTEALPNFLGAAQIGGTYYATLEAAIAEAGADDTVVLQADNAEDITLTEGQTFSLQSNGFTYSGTVTSANGYRLRTSTPDANGVITYSQLPSCKPSISINFMYSGNGLTTADDVGLSGYGVPGTSWNNFAVANTTYSTVNAVDSTGTASVMSGVSVAISGTRGSYSCSSLTAASNPLQGYVDESDAYTTPTVTVSGIPYYRYRVLVYHSTESANVPFGYDTINGTNYTYVNDVLSEGTTAWGNSGADNSANELAEGGNVLLTGELSGSTLTVVGHRAGGDSSARGCIAAIQIIEVKPEIGENDLEIPVSGATTYTVNEAKTLSGTVYITGNGTLTLDGSAKITSATVDVGYNVTLNVNADRLDGTTYTGSGTVVYDGVVPPTGKGWTDATWTGTVWIKNKSDITGNNNATTGVQPNSLGNSLSKVKFSGVNGWLEAPVEYNPEIVLENAGYDYALQLTNGNSPNVQNNGANANRATTLKKLSGSGTLCCGGTSTATPTLKVYDASGFTGSIDTTNADATKTGLVVVFCDEGASLPDTLVNMFINTNMKRTIYVASGKEMTLDSAATWTAETGFVIEGTLNANGTLASSHATKAVSGSGKVVFTGRGPTVSGDAWWKNEAWTGTVTVKSVTNLRGDSGTGTYIVFNDCGNVGSVIELNTVSGWINPGYVCTVPLKITGSLSLTDGYSGKANAFKVGTLLGSGSINGSGYAPTVVFNVTTDWSGFTGNIGLNNKCVVFGETIPDTITAGQIYVSEGAVVTNNVASGNWWAEGGVKVDGELCAPNLDKFGGGTTITTTDNGVFTLINSNDTQDHNVNYARITGTGTLRYADVSGKWRTLSTVNFPTNMVCENNLSAGLILQGSGAVHTIGSLAGSGQIRSDWGGSGNVGDRDLRILQAKDTTYSGVFASSNDRVRDVYVAPGETAGTLTLSGTQTASNGLTIESGAAVNLTGTWVGATTVAGTIGGTGTLTGNLTFSEGATFKAFASDENGFSVSGTISYPASGTVTVDLSALGASPARKVVLLTAASESEIDVSKFSLADGTNRKFKLAKEGATLVLKTARKGVFIGVY